MTERRVTTAQRSVLARVTAGTLTRCSDMRTQRSIRQLKRLGLVRYDVEFPVSVPVLFVNIETVRDTAPTTGHRDD